MTPGSRNISFPCWSPDGKWLAAEERIGKRTTLVILPPGGGEISTVPTDFAQNIPMDWSPDSTRILFAGFTRGAWNVYWVAMDGSRVEQLTPRGTETDSDAMRYRTQLTRTEGIRVH
ncbi:MAG: PD40 domain-containing protein [Acidobacteria bacterium]|nr:PD40 domain-containing protein [Acidobacteriota bacterium]